MNKSFKNRLEDYISESKITLFEFSKKSNIEIEVLKDLLNGNEPTVEQFINIAIAMETSFADLGTCFFKEGNHFYASINDLKECILKKDIEKIKYLFASNIILVNDGQLYLNTFKNKTSEAINENILKKLYLLLLDKKEINLLKRLPRIFEILNIRSLSFFNRYDNKSINHFLYGLDEYEENDSLNLIYNINLEMISSLNNFDLDSRRLILEQLLNIYKKYEDNIIKTLNKYGYLFTQWKQYFVNDGQGEAYEIYRLSLDQIDGCEDLVDKINLINKHLDFLTDNSLVFDDSINYDEFDKHDEFIKRIKNNKFLN